VAPDYPHARARTRINTHQGAPRRTEPQPPWQTWGLTLRYVIDRFALVASNLLLIWFVSGHR
jgi:hypothetical protein